MSTDYKSQQWLDSVQALDYLYLLTGLALGSRELLNLCVEEFCKSHVDCSFASGPAPENQLFVRKIRGAGHCELVESDERLLGLPTGSEHPLLCVSGEAVVHGPAWVYSSEGGPSREDGFWRIDLGSQCRPLCFRPSDLEKLAAVINGGGEPAREVASSALSRKSG